MPARPYPSRSSSSPATSRRGEGPLARLPRQSRAGRCSPSAPSCVDLRPAHLARAARPRPARRHPDHPGDPRHRDPEGRRRRDRPHPRGAAAPGRRPRRRRADARPLRAATASSSSCPGVSDPRRAAEVIGRTAQLTFHAVEGIADPAQRDPDSPGSTRPSGPTSRSPTRRVSRCASRRPTLTGEAVDGRAGDLAGVRHRLAGQHRLLRLRRRGLGAAHRARAPAPRPVTRPVASRSCWTAR